MKNPARAATRRGSGEGRALAASRECKSYRAVPCPDFTGRGIAARRSDPVICISGYFHGFGRGPIEAGKLLSRVATGRGYFHGFGRGPIKAMSNLLATARHQGYFHGFGRGPIKAPLPCWRIRPLLTAGRRRPVRQPVRRLTFRGWQNRTLPAPARRPVRRPARHVHHGNRHSRAAAVSDRPGSRS